MILIKIPIITKINYLVCNFLEPYNLQLSFKLHKWRGYGLHIGARSYQNKTNADIVESYDCHLNSE